MSSLEFAVKSAIAALELYGVEVSVEQADTVARGVLLAMREPSEAMVDAARGLEAQVLRVDHGDPEFVYGAEKRIREAMLTAALNDRPDRGG